MSGSSASGTSSKPRTAVKTSLSTFSLDATCELRGDQKQQRDGEVGWDRYSWGFFFFKVQSLWSKVQHIHLLSKDVPKCNPGLWGHHCPSGPFKDLRFRGTLPETVKAAKMWSARGSPRRHVGDTRGVCADFLLHCVRGKLPALASLNVSHESHTAGVELTEDEH